ncbi:extracellular solute-binding protein [Zavarzinia compransoris]|uniref:ABC transporter substrate-binding protein n=1 Tax=Zavarzinia compransoris TaxID=1264899 RepID=A0A317E929_9PROT|nr:extracellular solute-binding protein [Zavarzinia compransoris]PWR21615.1 hypothetical protein DKG75_06335 [Zavarzinia compransoris]TDP45605.1 putative spermidine/putrescine transport system substrate-binding protein/spermidine/putrescine transport system substrate-binding protein [Zavarzinia compransoris]
MRNPVRFNLLTVALAAAVALPLSEATAEGELNLLTWEGYADDVFVKPFTEKTGCVVNPTYVSSNDEMVSKAISAGSATIDLVSPSNDATMVLIDAGAVEALDTAKLPHLKDYYPAFQKPAWLTKGDRLYGLPYGFGYIRVALKEGAVAGADSIKALWDPALKGKLAIWDNLESLYLAARYVGVKDVYNMTDEELEAAKQALIALKPNIVKFWASDAEFAELYASGGIVGGNTTELALSSIWAGGHPELTEMVTKEQRGGWSDSWMVVKGAGENPCTYAWLDWMSSAESQAIASKVTGYAYANAKAFDLLDDATKALLTKLKTNDPKILNEVDWWQPVARRGKYLEVFNQAKAASAP